MKGVNMRKENMKILQEVSDNILAPSLIEFVKWILKSAAEQNVKRIYFLARDGYPLYKAAKILINQTEASVECRYLYCSRYAFRISCFHLMTKKEILDQICIGGIQITLRKILRRGGLRQDEVEKVAAFMGLYKELDVIIPYTGLKKYKELLLSQDLFWKILFSRSRKEYKETAGYLIQEGLLDNISFGIADSGWTGSIQMTLKKLLLSLNYQGNMTGYYFGLYELPLEANSEEYYAYYFGPRGNIKRKVYFSNCFFECVFSAPTGMCLGYRKCKDCFLPVFDTGQEKNIQTLSVIIKAVEKRAAIESAFLSKRIDKWFISNPKNSQKNMMRLMEKPTKEEAEIFGSLSFTDDVLDAGMSLAAPLSETQICDNSFFHKIQTIVGIKKNTIYGSAWMEGSIFLCGKNEKRYIRDLHIYKYVLYIKKSFWRKAKRE